MPSAPAPTNDLVLPFQIETGDLRGRLVRLHGALDEILLKHDYPDPVARLLAETVATGAALASMLKFAGKFSLQAKGDGAVTLLVADMTHDGGLRAYARYDALQVMNMGDDGIGLLGRGHLAFTIEPPAALKQESYQGIVALRGQNIAEAVQHYFRDSEQIPTGLVAAARRDDRGHWHGGCLILQHVPEDGGVIGGRDSATGDAWQTAMMLMSSCTPAELTDPNLAPENLLFRLFHESGVTAFPPRALRHACACAERIPDTLRLFSRAEIKDMAENGIVTMTCKFCNAAYRYTEEEIDRLFTPVV